MHLLHTEFIVGSSPTVATTSKVSMKEIFEDMIRGYAWGKQYKTPCGAGSTLSYTQTLRQNLKPLLIKHEIKSMFDAPCGDYSWMSTINIHEVVKYLGGDIVDFMIEENKKKYPGVEFISFDLTKDPIPDVDLLFCRDCLLHLSNENIDNIFKNISRSNVKYVLLSNFFEHTTNYRDIKNGSWRYSNFLEPPYNFSQPLDSITDFIKGYPNRSMLLWPKSVFIEYVERISK